MLVVGGGQGGIALGARLRQLGVPDDRHRQARPARRPVAQPLQVAVPARPGLVRPPALHQVPGELAGVRAQGQDRRLARVLHQGDGAQLLDEHRGQVSASYDEATREWTVEVERDGAAARAAAEAARARHRHVRQAQPARLPGHGRRSAATSTTRRRTRARTRTPARSASSIGSNNSAFDICGALWENGADVTMVQRSSTHIVRSDTLMDIGLGALYSEEAVAVGDDHGEGRPDLRLAAVPDHARVPDPAVRRRCASATRTSTTGSRRPGSSTTGATTARGCS